MANGSKKLFFGGVVTGAVVAPIALFSLGWIVTSGAASASAKESAQLAVVESLTPICMTQFSQDAAATRISKS